MIALSTNRRRAAAAGAIVAVTATFGLVLLGSDGSAGAASDAGADAPTVAIERKDLVETETVDGTLGFGDERTVINRLTGTLTWLPVEGSVIEPGDRLYQVDGDNVYLLDGSYPAYRTLADGITGRDVLQLETNLRALGFDDDKEMTVNQTWTDATTAAVERWQRDVDMDDDGSIELGRVVFQPGARRVGASELTAGQDASSAGGGSSTEPASATADEDSTQLAVYTAPVQRQQYSDIPTPTPTAALTPTPTPPATATPDAAPSPTPSAEPTFEPTSEPSVDPPVEPSPTPSAAQPAPAAPSAATGAPSGTTAATGVAAGTGTETTTASELFTTTNTDQIVTVDLLTSDLSLAERGATAEVELPEGDEVEGKIASVGTVATTETASDGTEGDATVEVVVEFTKAQGASALDQAPVDVDLEQERAEDVLTVPVTALIAQRGGTFAVEVRDGTAERIVPVQTGLYTDGDVQISGDGLEAGMTVTDARV